MLLQTKRGLSLSDLGSSARRSSPAAGGLPVSSPHRGAPRLLLPARARMERRPRRALLGGAESSSGQRARGGGGRRDPPWPPPRARRGGGGLRGEEVEPCEICSLLSSSATSHGGAGPRRRGRGGQRRRHLSPLLSSLLAMEVPADLGWCQAAARRRFGGPLVAARS